MAVARRVRARRWWVVLLHNWLPLLCRDRDRDIYIKPYPVPRLTRAASRAACTSDAFVWGVQLSAASSTLEFTRSSSAVVRTRLVLPEALSPSKSTGRPAVRLLRNKAP